MKVTRDDLLEIDNYFKEYIYSASVNGFYARLAELQRVAEMLIEVPEEIPGSEALLLGIRNAHSDSLTVGAGYDGQNLFSNHLANPKLTNFIYLGAYLPEKQENMYLNWLWMLLLRNEKAELSRELQLLAILSEAGNKEALTKAKVFFGAIGSVEEHITDSQIRTRFNQLAEMVQAELPEELIEKAQAEVKISQGTANLFKVMDRAVLLKEIESLLVGEDQEKQKRIEKKIKAGAGYRFKCLYVCLDHLNEDPQAFAEEKLNRFVKLCLKAMKSPAEIDMILKAVSSKSVKLTIMNMFADRLEWFIARSKFRPEVVAMISRTEKEMWQWQRGFIALVLGTHPQLQNFLMDLSVNSPVPGQRLVALDMLLNYLKTAGKEPLADLVKETHAIMQDDEQYRTIPDSQITVSQLL